MLIDRRHRGEDPWLNFKVGAFVAGGGIALAGIYFQADWLIAVAIGVLLLGFGVRFLGARDAGEGGEPDGEGS